MKPKNQRLVLIIAAIAAVLIAVLLAMWGLSATRRPISTRPADIAREASCRSDARSGSAAWSSRGRSIAMRDGVTIRFIVTDGQAKTPIAYRGIVPDLFREGSGAVADGRMERGTFVADRILAKHDERYMPPELGNLAAEHKAGKTLAK